MVGSRELEELRESVKSGRVWGIIYFDVRRSRFLISNKSVRGGILDVKIR